MARSCRCLVYKEQRIFLLLFIFFISLLRVKFCSELDPARPSQESYHYQESQSEKQQSTNFSQVSNPESQNNLDYNTDLALSQLYSDTNNWMNSTSVNNFHRGGNSPIAQFNGDIMLAAVFPIHERNQNYSCGSLQEESLLEFEALAYTLQRINENQNILPGIKLGVVAIDSCDSPHHALEQSLGFIQSFVGAVNATNGAHRNDDDEEEGEEYSDSAGSALKTTPTFNSKYGQFDRVLGLIGGQSSEVSLQLANVFRLFKVPQVSYMSTSPTLSDVHLYDFFFRTVPSDTNQVEAIVEILRKFRWTYVSVVYSDTEYGNNGYDLLSAAAKRHNICISNPQEINVERFTSLDYDKLITTLMHKINARVVVVFADKLIARRLMMAAKRRQGVDRMNRFVWIASDAWACRDSVVQGLESVVEGTISVTPLSYRLNDFIRYFRSLRPETNKQNPWFDEFWQRHFRCILPDVYEQYRNTVFAGHRSVQLCNESLTIHDRTIMSEPSMHFVRDAFYAFAITFDKIHRTLCNGVPGICARMRAHILNGTKLAQSILNVEFPDEGGNIFRFQPNGDAPPRYQVVNFQFTDNGTYEWKAVGTYMIKNPNGVAELDMHKKEMKFKRFTPNFPRSFCSEPCTNGQAKLQLEGDTCCWLCTNCSQYQFLPDEFHCADCPLGTVPDTNKTTCLPLPPIHLSITNWWTICAILFALTGMACTILTLIVFWRFSETPVIKAAGRELSILQLIGIFLSFGMSFVIVAKPSSLTCALTRFFLGFCYTVCYSAIVTKTNRISRIFRHRSCKKPRFTSPLSQLVITSILIAIEVFINVLWMFYDPPDTVFVYPTRASVMLICSGSDRTSYLFGLVYPLVLIGFCTVYAFKTRKCPEGFNEARYITFTNYTTCVVWLAFLPMFVMLSTTTPLRYLTLCFLMSVSGTVQLFCLFVPKMYIALLKPEKNTRESVMGGGSGHYGRALYANQFAYRHNADTSETNLGGHVSLRSTTTPTTTTTTLPDHCSSSSDGGGGTENGGTINGGCDQAHAKHRSNLRPAKVRRTDSSRPLPHEQLGRKQMPKKYASVSVSSTGATNSSPPPTPSPSPLFLASPLAIPDKAFVFYPPEAFCHLTRIPSFQRPRSTSSPMLHTNLDALDTSAVLQPGQHQKWPLIKLDKANGATGHQLTHVNNTHNNNNNNAKTSAKTVFLSNGH